MTKYRESLANMWKLIGPEIQHISSICIPVKSSMPMYSSVS